MLATVSPNRAAFVLGPYVFGDGLLSARLLVKPLSLCSERFLMAQVPSTQPPASAKASPEAAQSASLAAAQLGSRPSSGSWPASRPAWAASSSAAAEVLIIVT